MSAYYKNSQKFMFTKKWTRRKTYGGSVTVNDTNPIPVAIYTVAAISLVFADPADDMHRFLLRFPDHMEFLIPKTLYVLV